MEKYKLMYIYDTLNIELHIQEVTQHCKVAKKICGTIPPMQQGKINSNYKNQPAWGKIRVGEASPVHL